MVVDGNLSTLLFVSALGIYIHAMFLTISLGFPWVIMGLLYKWWKTRDRDYYDAVRTATGVLSLNFALGAITGTLVEFGLVQAWSGSIFIIATFGLMPFALELVAFVAEIVLLILFTVTLGKLRPVASIFVMASYLLMAVLSGILITTVNSWLNVPWGTADLAANLYPFLPQYSLSAVDSRALLKLKTELIRSLMISGSSSQIIQTPELARQIGLTLREPFVAFYSPYAVASMLHNVNAAMIIGISFALFAYAFKFFRTGRDTYLKLLRAFLPVLLVLLLLQPTVFGHYMGKTVATNQPTKFALMEAAASTEQNPLIGFLAYGDPQHPIVGFDSFREACDDLQGKTLGDLASGTIPSLNPEVASIELKSLCLADLAKAEARMATINFGYYSKITSGMLALVSVIALVSLIFRVGILSKIAERILIRAGRGRVVFLLSLLILSTSMLTASLGWYVRDGGRKPWTVYGLLYPEELITSVPFNPAVLALFTLTFLAMAIIGIYGMYIVASKPLKFIELIKKGAGLK